MDLGTLAKNILQNQLEFKFDQKKLHFQTQFQIMLLFYEKK